MTGKRKNIYLYLALICFISIILIFVFDGYVGLYDTATVTVGELPQVIGYEQWQDQSEFAFIPSVSVGYGQQSVFRYNVDNRRFSSYQADISVSLWRSQEKIDDIIYQPLDIGAFDNAEVSWSFNPSQYLSEPLPLGRTAEFTLVIRHGNIERKLLLYVFSTADQPDIKPVVPAGTR